MTSDKVHLQYAYCIFPWNYTVKFKSTTFWWLQQSAIKTQKWLVAALWELRALFTKVGGPLMKSCEYQTNGSKYNVWTIRSTKNHQWKERDKESSKKNENETRLTENNRLGINRPNCSFKSEDCTCSLSAGVLLTKNAITALTTELDDYVDVMHYFRRVVRCNASLLLTQFKFNLSCEMTLNFMVKQLRNNCFKQSQEAFLNNKLFYYYSNCCCARAGNSQI